MPDPIATSTLLGVRKALPKFDGLYLRLFFPSEMTFETEEIAFDKLGEDVRLAPFVSPMVAGKVIKEKGGKLMSFKPAYLKPKHIVQPGRLLKRNAGEALQGELSPTARRQAVVVDLLEKQEKSITYREEAMASEAVLTGKVVVQGEDYPTQVVDYERAAENNITLAGTTWANADVDTYDPCDDIEDWAEKASGAINIIIMGKESWRHFKRFKKTEAKLDTRRGSTSALETALKDLGKVVSFKGWVGDTQILVYTGQYRDEAGDKQYFHPVNKVVLGNINAEGIRAYGAIQDAKANAEGVVAAARWPKSWITDDPSVENLMTQSAPLMVTPDADEFVVVTTH